MAPPSLTVRRGISALALAELRRAGMAPNLVYIDADLDYDRCKRVLDWVVDQWPDAHIAGGAFDYAPGVRRAVQEVANARNLRLHVEQGQCWTFSQQAILLTYNTSRPVLLAGEPTVAGRATVDGPGWVHQVGSVMASGDNVERVRELCRGHGRDPAAARAADAACLTDPGPLAGEDPDAVLIDVGARDKRCRTVLMRAANKGRLQCVRALVHEFGARVNVQAERSGYTALHEAAYNGYTDIVRELLDSGANTTLRNRYNETAADSARQKGHEELARLIEAKNEETAAPFSAPAD